MKRERDDMNLYEKKVRRERKRAVRRDIEYCTLCYVALKCKVLPMLGGRALEGINNCDSFINELRIRVKNTKVTRQYN